MMMKKTFAFILVTFVLCLSAHSQNCNPEDLSNAGFEHFSKAQMHIGNLEQGGHMLSIGELKALLQTDSLWCYEVYLTIARLYEEISLENNGTKKLECLNNAILYYKKYSSLRPNNKEILNKLAELDALVKELDALVSKNKINIEMVFVEGMLNSDTTDCIHSFYIGKYEVTQAQWEAVMGSHPSHFRGPNLPVENISVNDAILFINELNRLTGNKYRLPTEEEWKYAANGGKEQNNYTYSGGYAPDKVGWTKDNSYGRTHSVGEKEPNSLGVYDMTGNVSEMYLTKDYYGKDIYKVTGGDYNSAPYQIDWSGNEIGYGGKEVRYIGIRLVLPVDNYSDNEWQWDKMIVNKNDNKKKVQQEEERRINEIRKKWDRKQSYFPIIRMDKIWSDVNIGYDFEGEGMYMRATVAPGPIYVSAFMTDKDTTFFSAGLKFRIINRFDLLLGLSYTPQENLWGGDVGLHYFIDKNVDLSGGVLFFSENRIIPHANISIYGFSLGVMRYNNHTIPSFGILMDNPPKEFNITSVYGFDFSNKTHILGAAGFVGPIYMGAHYQTDKSFHFSLGGMRTWNISEYDDDDYLGFHGAITYSTHNKIGLDIGLTFGIGGLNMDEEELAASIGALVYKDKVIPTVGLGGSVGLGSLGVAGLIAGVIWGGYKLYTEVYSHL